MKDQWPAEPTRGTDGETEERKTGREARGVNGLWGMYQWLDRAPRGRNEARTDDAPLSWFRRHDEYENA